MAKLSEMEQEAEVARREKVKTILRCRLRRDGTNLPLPDARRAPTEG